MDFAVIMPGFLVGFVPLFVAMDAPGLLPIYISLTNGFKKKDLNNVLNKSILTAFIIAILFVVAGDKVFVLLGISSDDFRIGGGIILMIIAIVDLIFSQYEERRLPSTEVGVVPIGMPLIMGPAALTTLLILVQKYGYFITIFILIVNLLIVWILFKYSRLLVRIIGEGGARAFGKLASLFLMAIAIMMIRVGVENILNK